MLEKKISDLMDYIQDDSVQFQIKNIASSEKIKEATMKKLRTNKNSFAGAHRVSRTVLVAAIVVMALSLSAFAIIHQLGLKDLEGTPVNIGGDERSTLSLSGLKGTPEYKAGEEWESYVQKWFKAGENLLPADGYVWDIYSGYGAHSQEAKDTLDTILTKYGLEMHKSSVEIHSTDELYAATGAKNFMPTVGNSGDYRVIGKLYDDGTIIFNCAALLPEGDNILYNFECLTKGTFTRGRILGDADDFKEWPYTTADGTEVLLALGTDSSLLVANLNNCFISIFLRSGSENLNNNSDAHSDGALPIDKGDLEAFAESFNFTVMNTLAG